MALDNIQDADFLHFADSQAEGPFPTAASRSIADAYIRRQFKGCEMITRYYKRCYNSLSITCRIPSEILSAIFGEVVSCAESQAEFSNDSLDMGHIDWIKSVSHVCSHWREVALATPDLWSYISLKYPPWAREMVLRSNPAPLTVTYQGPLNITSTGECTRSYKTLTEILRLHLPRIKNLTLHSLPTFDLLSEHDRSRSEYTSILSLLEQPAPMIERLEVRLLRQSEQDKLPYELFTMPSRLRYLVLEECAMAWDPELVDFRNLRSLTLLNLPLPTNPSLIELSTILRQTSHLESLNLEMREGSMGLSFPSILRVIDPVILGHLECVTLTGNLSYCLLLIHIEFSQKACSIHLHIQDRQEMSRSLVEELAGKLNRSIEGSNLSLNLGSHSIRCWNFKDTTQIPSFCDPPTVDIGFSDIRPVEMEFLWQSLRLDQLILLEVDRPLEQDSWTFFGNLPQLRDLRIRLFPSNFLRVLHHDLANKSMADTQPVRMTFPALRNITMIQCSFDHAIAAEHNTDDSLISVAEFMSSCFELRKKAGLSLDSLSLENCAGDSSIHLERLRDIIDRVEWIGIRDDDRSASDYDIHDEDFGYSEYGETEEMDDDFEPYIHDDYDFDDY